MECSCWPEDAGVGFVPFLTPFPWQAHAECPLEEAENQVWLSRCSDKKETALTGGRLSWLCGRGRALGAKLSGLQNKADQA